ncbi:LiaF domain-containing protein [Pseudoalteromonas sp.]|uniref:LiaF domain-containing protein n=1 Tax=Pseudoalteromonas sp. TaxID=53249 RepID=UPI001BD0DBB7|nr:LiaF domain-containing protein [Pseudoalteromonas sp.]
MSVKIEDRPIEQVREQVIDQLIYNYSHGVISVEAFERRLDDAMATNDNKALMALVEDLTLDTDQQYKAQKHSQFTPHYGAQHGGDAEPLKLRSILGSSERSGQWVVPQNIYIENYMGSINLDFTDAIFTHQHVTIYVNCYFGSEEIYVPEHVNVVSKMFCILGSFENKTVSLNKRQGPTIHIEGKTVLGSVEVKVKRTIKEKFISFANDLKTQLGMNGKHY